MKKKEPYNQNCIEDIWKLSHDQNIYIVVIFIGKRIE